MKIDEAFRQPHTWRSRLELGAAGAITSPVTPPILAAPLPQRTTLVVSALPDGRSR